MLIMIAIVLNGERREVEDGTVAELLLALGVPARGVAVAIDGEVVVRAEWRARRVTAGDRIEILSAAQGG